MRILFVGGTGVISSACVSDVLSAGHTLTVVNRGRTTTRPLPPDAEVLRADVRDATAVHAAVGGRDFDVVVDFVAYEPAHVRADIRLFAGRVGHYVFISSAAVHRKPSRPFTVTEATPRRNPHWRYAQDKIACENLLTEAFHETGFPATIVRPSHTYDRTVVPVHGGWTQIDRMRRGAPVVVHGDGTSLWTLTHHTDVASRLVGLLGNRAAIGEAFTITGDDVLTWDQIHTILGRAAGVRPRLVHVPTDVIGSVDPGWGTILRGDQAHSTVFDNAKVRALVPAPAASVPFEAGAREIVAWYDAQPARRVIDDALNATIDALCSRVG